MLYLVNNKIVRASSPLSARKMADCPHFPLINIIFLDSDGSGGVIVDLNLSDDYPIPDNNGFWPDALDNVPNNFLTED